MFTGMKQDEPRSFKVECFVDNPHSTMTETVTRVCMENRLGEAVQDFARTYGKRVLHMKVTPMR